MTQEQKALLLDYFVSRIKSRINNCPYSCGLHVGEEGFDEFYMDVEEKHGMSVGFDWLLKAIQEEKQEILSS